MNLKALKEFFENYPNILFVLIFGSYARDRKTPFSDLDLAIYFSSEPELLEIGGLIAKLEKITSVEVDVLILNKLYEKNPALAYEVITTGKLIFCKDEEAYIRYKEYTFLYYFDHLPLFERVRRDLKKRIKEGRFGSLGSR